MKLRTSDRRPLLKRRPDKLLSPKKERDNLPLKRRRLV